MLVENEQGQLGCNSKNFGVPVSTGNIDLWPQSASNVDESDRTGDRVDVVESIHSTLSVHSSHLSFPAGSSEKYHCGTCASDSGNRWWTS